MFRYIFAFALLIAAPANAQEVNESLVKTWMNELGHNDYRFRDNATFLLQKNGLPWRKEIELLAANPATEAEVRLRSEQILIELKRQRLWQATQIEVPTGPISAAKILEPLEVHIGDEYGVFSDAKIEVASGPYWKVIDEICAKGKYIHRPHYQVPLPFVVCDAGNTTMSPAVAYEGPFRLCVNSIERKYTKTNDLTGYPKSQKTDGLTMVLNLIWEPRFHFLAGDITPSAVGIGETKITARGNPATNYSANRLISTTLHFSPPSFSQEKIETLTVSWKILGCSEFTEKELSRKDVTAITTAYDAEFEAVTLEGRQVVVEWNLSSPVDDVATEFSMSIEHDGKRIKSQSHSIDKAKEYRVITTRFPIETLESGLPEDLKKQLLDNLKFFVKCPTILDERTVDFVFKDLPLPKID